MTDITTEKARIGAPSAQPFIDGFTEEGENLSPVNTGTNTSTTSEQPSAGPLAGASAKCHSHGGGVGVPDSSRAGRLTSYNLEDFKALTGSRRTGGSPRCVASVACTPMPSPARHRLFRCRRLQA